MTTARSCWKRLNTELEDSDECLPISKRICSLHIESQTHELASQNNHGVLVNPYHGFSDGAAASPPVVASSGGDPWSVASQPSPPCRLDFSREEVSSSSKTLAQLIQDNFVQGEMNQRIASAGPVATHFCHPLGDPHSAHLAYQQKLDPTFNQLHSGNLLYMPSSGYDQQNQHVSQRLSIHNEDPTIHNGIIHGDSSSIPQREGMPEYTPEFHIQQLPTGIYEPELGMEENPYYYCVNQLLYEAHLYRVRRGTNFSNSS